MKLETKNCIVNGHIIAYTEKNSSCKKEILFIHGNSLSKEIFRNQLASDQLKHYRLLALDLPGHGNSQWLDEYSINQIIQDIAAFCEQMDLNRFIIVGHSLGGHMGMQALPKLKHCGGIFLIGTPPLQLPLNIEEAFMPHPVIPLLFKGKLTVEETNLFAENLSNHENKAFITDSITSTDPNFREMMMVSIMNGDLKDETQILEQSKISVALVYGVDDVLVNKAYVEGLEISNLYFEKPIFISESRHISHLENWEEFNRVLHGFILEIQ